MELKAELKKGAQKALRGIARFLECCGDIRVITAMAILLSFSIALLLRLTPAKWGIYLNEFDPYYEYYLAEKVIEHSKHSILDGIWWWFSWWFEKVHPKDTLFWAPFGRDLRRTSQPGAALFSATLYYILKYILGINVSLYLVHALVAPVGAALATIAIYFLGKEAHSREAGILAALFLSISWSFMYRTNFGAKHEGIAIPAMILAFYFFLKSYRKGGSLLNSILAGISLGIVVFSWGAYLYPWNLLALITVLWLIAHPTDVNAAKAFLPMNLIAQFFIAITPRFGPSSAFYSISAALPMVANIASVLVLAGVFSRALSRRYLRTIVASTTGCLIAAFLVLWKLKILPSVSFRILAVIVPLWRAVAVTTVAEQVIPTWASLYQDYRTLLVLAFFGMLVLIPRKTLKSWFLVLSFFTSLYAAASMARLTLLLAPSATLLAAIGLSEAAYSLIKLLAGTKRRLAAARGQSISREAVVFALAIVVLITLPAVLGTPSIKYSHEPPLILTSSIPQYDVGNYRYVDWLSALEWIKMNIPNNTIIATWWDYGYWISVNTGKNTTCDNGTIDSRQIRRIARAFMSSEDVAIKIFKELGVKYVVVFEPFQPLRPSGLPVQVYYSSAYIGGDMAKSTQMARWIGLDPNKYRQIAYIRTSQGTMPVVVPADTPEARNATLYHLLFVKTQYRRYFIFERPPLPTLGSKWPGYEGPVVSIPQPKYFKLVYASEPNGWVMVFKVIYPEEKS